jgi:hypothetical protein
MQTKFRNERQGIPFLIFKTSVSEEAQGRQIVANICSFKIQTIF